MRHYNKWLLGVMAGAMLVSCSNDVIVPGKEDPNQVHEQEGVYMALKIQLPGIEGTRSYTDGDDHSNSGIEVGKDYENYVGRVMLVLADQSNGFIAASEVPNKDLVPLKAGDNVAYQVNSKFTKTQLNDYYDAREAQGLEGVKPVINVFLFVNPAPSMVDALSEETLGSDAWVNYTYSFTGVNDYTLWNKDGNGGKGSFTMTNLYMAERELPESLDKWSAFSTVNHPFDLSGINNGGTSDEIDNFNNDRGVIKVQRMAARFDFKDGSPEGTAANTYEVLFAPGAEGEDHGPSIVNVELNRMILVNMSNQMYWLKRTSNDGLPRPTSFDGDNDFKILGPEKPWYTLLDGTLDKTLKGNYVIDVYANDYVKGVESDFSAYFYSAFFADSPADPNDPESVPTTEGGFGTNGRWAQSTYLISDILKNENDQYQKNPGDYHIWRYASENTIPAEPTRQVNGISTGIIFKGKLQATEAAKDYGTGELYKLLNETELGNTDTDPIIYEFNNTLYVSWEEIRAEALRQSYDPNKETDKFDRTTSLYKAVFGSGGTGTHTNTIDGNEMTIVDDLAQDQKSANYCWEQWDAAGKPGSTNQLNKAFKTAAVENGGITLYQSSNDENDGWGYYCYYYYWNRHNDNGNNGIMGPMEFAVVRNNVYKIAVTQIGKLGHPRLPENDPDKPTPDTPDESEDLYITVTAEVLPWVVRINNAVF